ncbi:hypothetical protein VHUM_03922 [Vanrija humicola]|uniref:CsbD-like domain-containing protein n=1 Tax=Vanrija humicola TaxID=5417 RepID=A0A7D8YVY0_VANHU|nr:hypothetical protein VHUM_03922 [Vanrija humicola]
MASDNEPSQISGNLKAAQGAAYSAVGAVLPSALGGDSWAESGAALSQQGQEEVDAAKGQAKTEATVDSAKAKAKSAWGTITGNQDLQTEGNAEAESAQWKYKQANSDSVLAVPVPSLDGAKGKLQSAVGAATGNQELQNEGNVRAEKAAWRDGV